MPEKPPSAPAQILKNIEAGSQRVNQLATELSQRIVAFEDWLNQLPGKVETFYWITVFDEIPPHKYEFGLHFDRSGKRWTLSYTYQCDQDTREIKWEPLSEASVETKLSAIEHFPQFLIEITEAQDALAKKLEKAHSEFDAFADAIGLTQREEVPWDDL